MEHCSIKSGTTDGTTREHTPTGITGCSKNRSVLFRHVPLLMEQAKAGRNKGYSTVFDGCSICSVIFTPTVGEEVMTRLPETPVQNSSDLRRAQLVRYLVRQSEERQVMFLRSLSDNHLRFELQNQLIARRQETETSEKQE